MALHAAPNTSQRRRVGRAAAEALSPDLASRRIVLDVSSPPFVSRLSQDDRDVARRVVTVLAVALLLLLVARWGWCSDDAFHTFRALRLWREGYGLTSNPDVRVQSFTHPLFALIALAPFAWWNEPFGVALGIDLVASAGAATVLAFSLGRRSWSAPLAIAVLCFSKAYVDYSTSGLENPLSHLLLALFIRSYGRRDTRWLFLWAALLGLNRLDALLVVAPAMVEVLGRARSRIKLKQAMLGFLPLCSWEIFSIVYYGFPFPNTAYAKLNNAISAGQLALQGLTYLGDSFQHDPVTLLAIIGVIASFFCRRPWDREAVAVSTGALFYLLYVVKIGGDFMSGRFLTVPLFACVAIFVARTPSWLAPRHLAVLSAGLAVLAVHAPHSPFRDSTATCNPAETGIVDERACYATHTALLRNLRRHLYRTHDYYKRGADLSAGLEPVVAESAVGMTTFAAGPKVTFVDQFALEDAFLARIPYWPEPDWRVGHFVRQLPEGYVDTVRTGANTIENRCLHDYYDILRRAISGPLFTVARWKAIAELNLGVHDGWASGICSQ
jgi:arabinofuranosyltransferase